MGYERFAEAAEAAGVDGALTVDLPPDEANGFLDAMRPRNLDAIFLLAPTSTEERIEKICRAAGGFVYYVSVKGITGAGNLSLDEVAARLERIRSHTGLPVGVGFGIKDAETARAVARVSDAVIVGSALVNRVEALADTPDQVAPAIAEVLSAMREAMDRD
jgi:tryptophan synthase alpha chain